MTTNRLGVLALAVLGVHLCVTGITGVIGVVGFMLDAGYAGNVAFVVAATVVSTAAGAALLRWRVFLSTWLFGTDDVAIGRVSSWDAQVAGLAILGVWLVATGIPELVLRVVWIPDPPMGSLSIRYREYPVGEFLRDGFGIAIGLFLVFKGCVVAHLWCPSAAEDPAQ